MIPFHERARRVKERLSCLDVAEHFGMDLEPAGNGWLKTRCPGHDDNGPSLKIRDRSTGEDRAHDFGECNRPYDQIDIAHGVIGFTGLQALRYLEELAGLDPDSVPRSTRRQRRASTRGATGGATPEILGKTDGSPRKQKSPKRKVVRRRRYEVRDVDGTLKLTLERVEYERLPGERKARKDFYPYLPGRKRAGLGGRKREEFPLYGADRLGGWDADEVIAYVEGPGVAEALWAVGIPAVATTTSAGGLPGAGSFEVLRGRKVALCPDDDVLGKEHMERAAKALFGVAELRLFLPGDGWQPEEHDDLADHPAVAKRDAAGVARLKERMRSSDVLDAEGLARLRGVLGLPETEIEGQGKPGSGTRGSPGSPKPRGTDGSLPSIQVNHRQMRAVTAEVLAALVAANDPPELFERSGQPVRVVKDEEGVPRIQELNADMVKHHMNEAADFVRRTKEGLADVHPPGPVAKDVLASRRRPFPRLVGVVETPFLRPDGSVREEPGYDPSTELYYAPVHGFKMLFVPEEPMREDVDRAVSLLAEAVGEIPYDGEASFANALALLLTAVVRQAIRGPVPLAIVDKPQAGTGGSLLAEVAALIATGRPAEMLGAPDNDEEWRKLITAKLYAGAAFITIDNVDGPLYAPSLARALTARTWGDRILGLSKSASLTQNAIWVATGNNILLRGDLPRRCYWIRLDAKTSRPWQRDGFVHPDLPVWVLENRGALVRALLVLARAWWAAGCPRASNLPKLGSFESWAETVGGILANAGVPAFLGNLGELYENTAEGDSEWEVFYLAWSEAFGADPVTVRELTDHLEGDDAFREAVPPYLAEALSRNRESFVRKFGNALSKRVEKRYGDEGLRVVKAGEAQRATKWKLARGEAGELGSFLSFYNPDLKKDRNTKETGGGKDQEERTRSGRADSRNSPTHPKFSGPSGSRSVGASRDGSGTTYEGTERDAPDDAELLSRVEEARRTEEGAT